MTEQVVAVVEELLPELNAPRLYDSWLSVAAVGQWMPQALQKMGLPGELQTVEIDPKVGGEFCFSDLRNSGNGNKLPAVHWGIYLELEPHSKIVFTWNAGSEIDRTIAPEKSSVVTLAIHSLEPGCKVVLEHRMDAAWAEYIPRVEASWRNMLQTISSCFTK